MKKSLFFIALFMCSNMLTAQNSNEYIEMARDILKTEKKSVVAEEINLSDSELVPFWELYNQYNSKLNLVQNQRVALIKDFVANYETLTDEKADEIMSAFFKYQEELVNLKKYYYGKFKKLIGKGKAAKYFQLENKIQTMVDAELSAQIPLIETK